MVVVVVFFFVCPLPTGWYRWIINLKVYYSRRPVNSLEVALKHKRSEVREWGRRFRSISKNGNQGFFRIIIHLLSFDFADISLRLAARLLNYLLVSFFRVCMIPRKFSFVPISSRREYLEGNRVLISSYGTNQIRSVPVSLRIWTERVNLKRRNCRLIGRVRRAIFSCNAGFERFALSSTKYTKLEIRVLLFCVFFKGVIEITGYLNSILCSLTDSSMWVWYKICVPTRK